MKTYMTSNCLFSYTFYDFMNFNFKSQGSSDNKFYVFWWQFDENCLI